MIIKFNGKPAKKKDCRKFDKEYYEKNVDCFEVNKRWYTLESNLIYYDNFSQSYCRINALRMKGIIGADMEEGYFQVNPLIEKGITKAGRYITFLNKDVALANNFIDCLSNNYFYESLDYNEKGYENKDEIEEFSYHADNSLEESLQKYNELYKPKIPFSLKKLGRVIKGFKFGIEIETSKGYIKSSSLIKHGFIPLKDGSLRNDNKKLNSVEFSSVPLEGAKGLNNIVDFCKILQDRCEHNIKCSLHVHVSGYKPSKLNVVVLYKVIELIQDELLTMFPYYKTDHRSIEGKSENYCKKLSKVTSLLPDTTKENTKEILDDWFISMFQYLSLGYEVGQEANIVKGAFPIPRDKWNIPSRKHLVNFVSFIFSKPHTVEYRVHENTFNEYKIIYWILICIGILKFTDKESVAILKRDSLTLDEILRIYDFGNSTSNIYTALSNYVKERITYFQALKKNGDYIGVKYNENDFHYRPKIRLF